MPPRHVILNDPSVSMTAVAISAARLTVWWNGTPHCPAHASYRFGEAAAPSAQEVVPADV